MGELHIDVIKERIRSEYKIDAELGPLQISYKETLLNKVSESHSISHQIGKSYLLHQNGNIDCNHFLIMLN